MRFLIKKFSFLIVWILSLGWTLNAQEHEIALPDNALLENYHRPQNDWRTRTVLSLPFFEDFNDSSYYPNIAHWQDSMVYVNNNMGMRNKSHGVATFDALDAKGQPYTENLFLSVYADSLTSQYFDFSTRNPSDSIYLSFLFQGKGNGYTPAAGDSLMLFFQRSNGAWVKVWDKAGMSMTNFETAMIPVKDTMFFHTDFRFRWVNKATFNVGNSHWQVDYVKLNTNRNYQDSVWNDVAFTYWGDNDLNRSLTGEYMSMPYRHFNANRNQYFSNALGLSLWNSWLATKELSLAIKIKNANTGASYTTSSQNTFVLYNDAQYVDVPISDNSTVISTNTDAPLNIDMEAYFTTNIAGDYSKLNDTIRQRQVFDNYFAYDDGSAESAFFMSSYQGVPSYVAQEYALSVADTIRGVDIYFPRQLPEASMKLFYLQIYKKIDAVGGVNDLAYQQIDLYPAYEDRVNGFVRYQFDTAIPMEAGTFYVAMMFPAGGSSDSLYIGLDKNKKGANYRYYKVGDFWLPSLIDGALMIRPLVGNPLPVSIADSKQDNLQLSFYPNPVLEYLFLKQKNSEKNLKYTISNTSGQIVQEGHFSNSKIDCRKLIEGIYFINIISENGVRSSKKFYKISK